MCQTVSRTDTLTSNPTLESRYSLTTPAAVIKLAYPIMTFFHLLNIYYSNIKKGNWKTLNYFYQN